MVPSKLLGNDQWALNVVPNPDGSAADHGWKMGLFELLNDFIMMSYLPPFQTEIWKLIRRKIWWKMRWRKVWKLAYRWPWKNCSSRHIAGRVKLAMFGWVSGEISFGFFGRWKLGKWGLNSCTVCMKMRKRTEVIAWVFTGYMASSKAKDGS